MNSTPQTKNYKPIILTTINIHGEKKNIIKAVLIESDHFYDDIQKLMTQDSYYGELNYY
jgi:hypothetical protein